MSVKHPNIKFQLNGISAIPFMSMLLANERTNVRIIRGSLSYKHTLKKNKKTASKNIIASYNRDNNILFISLYFSSGIELKLMCARAHIFRASIFLLLGSFAHTQAKP